MISLSYRNIIVNSLSDIKFKNVVVKSNSDKLKFNFEFNSNYFIDYKKNLHYFYNDGGIYLNVFALDNKKNKRILLD
jgi:hypothetical protein